MSRMQRESRMPLHLRFAAGVFALLGATLAADQPAPESAAALESLLGSGRHPYLQDGDFTRDRQAIRDFYERRRFRPAWLDGPGPSRQGALLLQALRGAADRGLRPGDYDATALAGRAISGAPDIRASPSRQAELDLALSIAAARWIRHLHFGRVDPRAAGFATRMPRAAFDVAAALERLATGDDFDAAVTDVEPRLRQYGLVKRALQGYRLLAVERELTNLPALRVRSVRPGEPYEGAAALRRLLVALGDLAPGDAGQAGLLDEATVAALRRFQDRHGLAADGVLGRRTLAALTTPLAARAEQLALALERWRWLPELSASPIVVNIPQFRLLAAGGTDGPFQTDVIVGRANPALRTPAFTALLETVVFRPCWEVPRSILENELLPRIRADLGYLARHDLEIVSATDVGAPPVVPSAQAVLRLAAGELRLRQRPGEGNSLGLVKLVMPNPYSVYLHSTPERHLFEEARRTFSHGCIRVRDAVGLVEHVLRDEPGGWTRARIEAAMHDDSPAGDDRQVALAHPKPVLVVYGTAIVAPDGRVSFFEDVYGHDAKLERLLREAAR
jgi:murein L,D-transpeptidase YcbB/YkuD